MSEYNEQELVSPAPALGSCWAPQVPGSSGVAKERKWSEKTL